MKAPQLRAAREAKVLSQDELAQKAGVSRITVSHLESGRDAYPSTIRKLATALGVEPGTLTSTAPSGASA